MNSLRKTFVNEFRFSEVVKKKKNPSKQNSSIDVSKFYLQVSGNRQTSSQLDNFGDTDPSCVSKFGLTSFINKDSANFRLKVHFYNLYQWHVLRDGI